MDTFFNTIQPIIQMFVDNWWYFVIMITLISIKSCRFAGLLIILSTAAWGFQDWIPIVFGIIGVLSYTPNAITYVKEIKNTMIEFNTVGNIPHRIFLYFIYIL